MTQTKDLWRYFCHITPLSKKAKNPQTKPNTKAKTRATKKTNKTHTCPQFIQSFSKSLRETLGNADLQNFLAIYVVAAHRDLYCHHCKRCPVLFPMPIITLHFPFSRAWWNRAVPWTVVKTLANSNYNTYYVSVKVKFWAQLHQNKPDAIKITGGTPDLKECN